MKPSKRSSRFSPQTPSSWLAAPASPKMGHHTKRLLSAHPHSRHVWFSSSRELSNTRVPLLCSLFSVDFTSHTAHPSPPPRGHTYLPIPRPGTHWACHPSTPSAAPPHPEPLRWAIPRMLFPHPRFLGACMVSWATFNVMATRYNCRVSPPTPARG